MTDNKDTKKASDLKTGDKFVDPMREGRPAEVVDELRFIDGRVHMTLDDDTKWAPWAASYGPDDRLEML